MKRVTMCSAVAALKTILAAAIAFFGGCTRHGGSSICWRCVLDKRATVKAAPSGGIHSAWCNVKDDEAARDEYVMFI
jgi:hypothetical protein